MRFYGTGYSQPGVTNKEGNQFSIVTQTTAYEGNMQRLHTLALSWVVRENAGHVGRAVKCSCSSLTAHAQPCALCLSACWGLGTVWPMLEGENARLTSESSGWCLVPWALQHHCCQTPRPPLLLLEPPDQTLGTGLSKPISSWREDRAERLWCSLLARKGDKGALCFDSCDQSVCSAVYCVLLCISARLEMCVLLTDHTWTALSAAGGSLQNNICHVPICWKSIGWCVLSMFY